MSMGTSFVDYKIRFFLALLMRHLQFNIDRQSARPDQELVKLQLEGLIQERKEGVTPESVLRHAKVVNELIGICESELWRKFTVDIRQALTDSKSKYYIDAHDRLLAVQTMIGDESDYRYKKAGELLDDKKVIPARVRKSPGRYRKD